MKILYPENMRFPMERANSIQIVNTCYALARQGCKVNLLVRKMNNRNIKECLKFYGIQEHPNLIIYRLPVLNRHFSHFLWNGSYYISCLIKLIIIYLESKPDIIITRNIRLASWFIKLRKITGIPVIFEVHNIDYLFRKDLENYFIEAKSLSKNEVKKFKDKEKFVYKNVDGLITITENLKEILLREFHISTPITVIPDGTNIIKRESLKKENTKIKNICYIGQLTRWKGVDILIKSMKFIDNAELTIIGGLTFDPDLNYFKNMVLELGLIDKIKFIGFIPPNEIKNYIYKFDVAIIPLPENPVAKYFTSPLKLFEYMAAKVPIVASDLPSIREILENGRNAVLVEPSNPQALAEGIKMVLNNPKLAETIVENAYIDVQKYTWDERAKKIIKFINKIN